MEYQRTFPKCPYRGMRTKHCSHKHGPKRCPCLLTPEDCEKYKGWENTKKRDSDCVESPQPLNLKRPDND